MVKRGAVSLRPTRRTLLTAAGIMLAAGLPLRAAPAAPRLAAIDWAMLETAVAIGHMPVAACELVRDFLDTLTNWYIRRSRDRFWEGDETAIDRYFARRRERKGYHALAEGMLAVASGGASAGAVGLVGVVVGAGVDGLPHALSSSRPAPSSSFFMLTSQQINKKAARGRPFALSEEVEAAYLKRMVFRPPTPQPFRPSSTMSSRPALVATVYTFASR